MRISLYLDHRPERHAIVPEVATLLGMPEGDRVSVLQGLWSYIKANGLQDQDQRHIRTDQRLRKVSNEAEDIGARMR